MKHSQVHFMNGKSKAGLKLQRPPHNHYQLQNKITTKNVTVEKLATLFYKFKLEKYFKNLLSKVSNVTWDLAGSLDFT